MKEKVYLLDGTVVCGDCAAKAPKGAMLVAMLPQHFSIVFDNTFPNWERCYCAGCDVELHPRLGGSKLASKPNIVTQEGVTVHVNRVITWVT